MHDSSASRFRQRAGSTRGSATILRLLPQPPPSLPCPPCSPLPRLPHRHVSSSDRDFLPCKHGAAEPTGGTRGRRATASARSSASGASSRPGHRRPAPGSGPTETPPGQGGSGGAGPPAQAARGSGGPRAPPRRLSRLGPCTDRRCAGAAAARSPFPYAARQIIALL